MPAVRFVRDSKNSAPLNFPPIVMVIDVILNIILEMSEAYVVVSNGNPLSGPWNSSYHQVLQGKDWEERGRGLPGAANFLTTFYSEENGGTSILFLS